MKEDQLIFLISQPRSGSTLMQKMLGAHSKIYTRSEPWLMLHPSYSLKRGGIYSEYNFDLERVAFNSFIEDLPKGKETYIQELRGLYLNLYSYYMSGTEYKYFLDKTPRYHLITDELMQIYPKSKFIFLLRNPLAVMGSIINTWTKESWFKLSDFKYDLLRAVDTFVDIVDNKHEDFMIVRYEELINENEVTLEKLFNYLDLFFEKDVLKYHEKNNEKWIFGDPVNVYKKNGIDIGNDNKWQRGLTNPQYWRVMYDYLFYIGKEKLCKLGYDFSENLDVLTSNMPADTLDELKSKTFPLFSFLDDTRECLIENQTKQRVINKKEQELQGKDALIAEREQELQGKDALIAEREQELQGKDALIAKKEQELQSKDALIAKRKQELNEILSSKKYKFGCAIAYPYLKMMGKR